jgi:hypothetical protein
MDNDQSQKITSSMMATVIAIVAVLPTIFVYAQTNTTTPEEESTTTVVNNATGNATTTAASIQQLVTPSAAAQQIINNTQTECKQAQFPPRKCVILVYESPTTVVLNGEALIFGGSAESIGNYPNPFLWRAVDAFKAQGYTISAIGMSGAGNKSSPNEFHVIMSK